MERGQAGLEQKRGVRRRGLPPSSKEETAGCRYSFPASSCSRLVFREKGIKWNGFISRKMAGGKPTLTTG